MSRYGGVLWEFAIFFRNSKMIERMAIGTSYTMKKVYNNNYLNVLMLPIQL